MTRLKGRRSERRLPLIEGLEDPVPERPGLDYDPEKCQETRYSVDLGDEDRVKARLLEDQRRQLVDFSLTQQHLRNGQWEDVRRVDCHLGVVHSHQFYADGSQDPKRDKIEIKSHDDVTEGCSWAEDLLFDAWEENLRIWGQR